MGLLATRVQISTLSVAILAFMSLVTFPLTCLPALVTVIPHRAGGAAGSRTGFTVLAAGMAGVGTALASAGDHARLAGEVPGAFS